MENIKVVATFKKHGLMRYISHLDFVRLIYRSLRRADVPYMLSQGFHRRPKVSFGKALKVGEEGYIKTTFFLTGTVDVTEFKCRLEQQLTEGIEIIDIGYGK